MQSQRFFAFLTSKKIRSLEVVFANNEALRQTMFGETLHEQGLRYLTEMKDQADPDRLRTAEFDGLMATLHNTFVTGEISRELEFRNSETEQEKASKSSQALREKTFADGEATREALFQRDYDFFLNRSIWYSYTREQHIHRGHADREEVFRSLEKAVEDQFQATFRYLQESFASNQFQFQDTTTMQDMAAVMEYQPRVWGGVEIQSDPELRQEYSSAARPENIIINEGVARHKPRPVSLQGQGQRKLPAPTKPRISSSTQTSIISRGRTMSRTPTTPSRNLQGVREYKTRPSSATPRKSIRSYSRGSRVSARDSRAMSQVSAPQDPSISIYSSHAPMPRSSQTAVYGPNPAILEQPGPAGDESDPPSPSDSPVRPMGFNHHGDQFDSRFAASLGRQARFFSLAEEHKEKSFRYAETQRDKAEASRDPKFREEERKREDKFRMTMKAYDSLFRQRESTHRFEEGLRIQSFDSRQEQYSHRFEQILIWERERLTMLETSEAQWIKAMQDKIANLQRLHETLFEQARRHRHATIKHHLGHRPTIVETGPPRKSHGSEAAHTAPTLIAPLDPIPSRIRQNGYGSRNRSSDDGSRSHTRPRPPVSSPPTELGFPEVATKEPLDGVLPVSTLENTDTYLVLMSNKKRTRSFKHAERQRQVIFDNNQNTRARLFEYALMSRRYEFQTNEVRRQTEFEGQQRHRKEMAKRAEHARETSFAHTQAERALRFQEAEEMRMGEFQKQEQRRQQEFMVAQAWNEETFHEFEGDLERKCFQLEQQRSFDFAAWQRAILHSTNAVNKLERDNYALEERYYQDILAKAMARSPGSGAKSTH